MNIDVEVVNLAKSLAGLTESWSPRVVAAMNEMRFKIARLEGDFIWHHHEDTDEAFYVVSGTLVMELRDCEITIRPGELFVVPKGVEHRPCSKDGCEVLLISPEGTLNTGNVESERTVEADVWLV